MGFLSGLKKLVADKEEVHLDPNVELIQQLLEDSREQRKEMMALVTKVMDQQQQSQFVMQKMMQQYVAEGENVSTTLDSRLFAKQEKLEDDMWVNMDENPFRKLGLS